MYKEKFGTVTGKPFSEEAIVKAEVVIGNATDKPGFRVGLVRLPDYARAHHCLLLLVTVA